MKTKIVTFGEIMIRLSKPGYQRLFQGRNFEGNYGGSEANAAVSLAFMGDNVEYVTLCLMVLWVMQLLCIFANIISMFLM